MEAISTQEARTISTMEATAQSVGQQISSCSIEIQDSEPFAVIDKDDVDEVNYLCQKHEWAEVLKRIVAKPLLALARMKLNNNLVTSILHSAIISKGDPTQRVEVILTILCQTPDAAKLKNAYGSLPLHMICQRTVKIESSKTKERLIREIIRHNYGALSEPCGGSTKRTPIHTAVMAYYSFSLTKFMIENGKKACFMRDSNGFLPAHCACTRHCSRDKLRLLLDVNPWAIFAQGKKGESLMDLTISTATKAHSNKGLIEELQKFQSKSSSHLEWKTSNDADGDDPQLENLGFSTNSNLGNSASDLHNKLSAGTQHQGDAEQYPFLEYMSPQEKAEALLLTDEVLDIMGSAPKDFFYAGDDLPRTLPAGKKIQDDTEQYLQENAGVFALSDAMLEDTGSATKSLSHKLPSTRHSQCDAEEYLSQQRLPLHEIVIESKSTEDCLCDHKRAVGDIADISQKQGKLRKMDISCIQRETEMHQTMNSEIDSSEVETGCKLGTSTSLRV